MRFLLLQWRDLPAGRRRSQCCLGLIGATIHSRHRTWDMYWARKLGVIVHRSLGGCSMVRAISCEIPHQDQTATLELQGLVTALTLANTPANSHSAKRSGLRSRMYRCLGRVNERTLCKSTSNN